MAGCLSEHGWGCTVNQLDVEALRTAIYIIGALIGGLVALTGYLLRRHFDAMDVKLDLILTTISDLRDRVTVVEVHLGLKGPLPTPSKGHK